MATDTLPVDEKLSRVRRRRDWRDGGRTVKPWDESVLAIALVALGIALLAAAVIRGFDSAPASTLIADAVVLVGMLTATLIAFMRARPKPLLRFRAIDLVYGLAVGLILRLIQGWLEVAAGGDGALPAPSSQGAWALSSALLVVSPFVVEVFLRGVLLVTAYSVVRRMTSPLPAMITAIALSAAATVAVQAVAGGSSWDAWLTPLIVGVVCGALVMATGRVWGAVLVHLFFNASWIALAAAGMQWG